MSPQSVRTAFRVVAVAEALSWAALLVAMFFKWVVIDDPHAGSEGGVPIAGPIHGGIFVAFLIVSVVAWRTFAWSPKVLVLALLSSIPPFCTVLFEVKADRAGLLTAPTTTPRPTPTA